MFILGELSFEISKIDSPNLIVAFVGMLIVSATLIGLYYSFISMPILLRLINRISEKRNVKAEARNTPVDQSMVSVDVGAAISTALYLYMNELHDDERTVLTIQKISKRYSPWSSKIYSVTRGLNQRF